MILKMKDGTVQRGTNVLHEDLIFRLNGIQRIGYRSRQACRVGFFGLIAPRIARRLIGIHYRYMMPISGLAGVVISIIGVPYFVYLLFKSRA